MTKKIILIIILFSLKSIGQTPYDSGCFTDKKYDKNKVTAFKDKFTLTLNLDVLISGKQIYPLNVKHKEEFTDETSLIKLNDTLGLKISIARITDYGRKKYLINGVILKHKDCWTELANFGWLDYKIGTKLSAYTTGTFNTDNFFSIEGIGADCGVKVE